jgi:Skp family chaperone for outer membrane proteins
MAGKLTPQAQRDLEVQFQRKQRDLQRQTEDLEADVGNRRNDVLQRVGRQMSDIIRNIAEAKSLDAVVDVQNTLYFKPELDLTKEVTEAYDKAYPAQ